MAHDRPDCCCSYEAEGALGRDEFENDAEEDRVGRDARGQPAIRGQEKRGRGLVSANGNSAGENAGRRAHRRRSRGTATRTKVVPRGAPPVQASDRAVQSAHAETDRRLSGGRHDSCEKNDRNHQSEIQQSEHQYHQSRKTATLCDELPPQLRPVPGQVLGLVERS
ncbi:hypothetical protein ANTPLA_LOCUS2329 [Anthophora plagiata]